MNAQFRDALERCDVDLLRSMWAQIAPHLPQPKTREEALIVCHRARTEAASLRLDLRVYSHRWLMERGIPSGLPDELKPKSDRIYPRVVSAVGVCVHALSEHRRPFAKAMEAAIAEAVAEAYADGKTEPGFVSKRMRDARERFLRRA